MTDKGRPKARGQQKAGGDMKGHAGTSRTATMRRTPVMPVMPVVVPWPDDGALKIVGSGTGQQVSRGPEQHKRGGCIGRNI